ncbi:CRISPR-associated endonuclease Cas3'' [Ramlibacter sp.]|uniref:CRISPR-associated endonuclease Cas3'' n=1 Tax=Ramlibacter sp. TaxID=1917967 RepID=UPI0025E81D92|nr:CRISPR-associated endonuclease Cas3'' [Ramlibacter sp.]
MQLSVRRNGTISHFAHSWGEDRAVWQSLPEHLRNVGLLAAERAGIFGGAPLAQVQGLLHDLGKYTEPFQARLAGAPFRVDHSTWGAKIAAERFGPMGLLLAYGIAGHHAGLANGAGEGERTALCNRLAVDDLPALDACWQQDFALPSSLTVPAGFKAHSHERGQFQLAFLARMLFSCLVDADYIDTEAYYDSVEKRTSFRSGPAPTLEALRAELDKHLSRFMPDGDVNRLRADVLRHVRAQASQEAGLFSLTVPTGGGKTLASLAFALDHAIRHGLRRVVFVIPFTSIIEQNARVFREALGPLGDAAVLEHHSAFVEQPPAHGDPDRDQSARKLRLAMENWDAPIVVTTAVQFFESLFAARPSACRKLHNIAGSVVILDEAQMLPLRLLMPCVAAIDELARNYRTSVVLCTATQPALKAPEFADGLTCVRELAPDPPRLFQRLERVRIRHAGTWTDDDLSAQMRGREQVLCIVNNRRHARAVYESMAGLPGARHLSTFMCAKHRGKVLDEVRQLLRDKQPCRLVSTSLIEAGVDVDFPSVLRAEAGLDSIAQAAGRCNREGRRAPEHSEVLVFATANEDWAPPTDLVQFAQAGREVLHAHREDPLSPAAIESYFRQLYWQRGPQRLDACDLMGLLRGSRAESLPLETLAAKFRMIDDVQMPVIVPWDTEAKEALRALEFAEGSVRLARALQPYLVQIPRHAFAALREVGAVQPVRPDQWGEQFMALPSLDLYDKHVGLRWDNPTFIDAEKLHW